MSRNDLQLDYEQTLETYRQLVEIRFKLLTFVPALSGVAVALLTAAEGSGSLDQPVRAAIAILGFLVTLGIVLYDQRNTQYHNGAITRAKHLEARLGFRVFDGDEKPGLFGSRKSHSIRRLFWVPIRHDWEARIDLLIGVGGMGVRGPLRRGTDLDRAGRGGYDRGPVPGAVPVARRLTGATEGLVADPDQLRPAEASAELV